MFIAISCNVFMILLSLEILTYYQKQANRSTNTYFLVFLTVQILRRIDSHKLYVWLLPCLRTLHLSVIVLRVIQ